MDDEDYFNSYGQGFTFIKDGDINSITNDNLNNYRLLPALTRTKP